MQTDRGHTASKVEPRSCVDDSRVALFLDREFDGVAGLIEEFPLLVGPCNRSRRIVLEEDGRVIAHAAWRPLRLLSREERLLAAGIGLVTTHRARRGRGYATRVVLSCLERAKESGADLALLFAPERGLYRRLGFVPAGRERVTRVDPGLGGAELRLGDARDALELLHLLERHPVRIERTLSHFETLLRVPGAHTYVLERDGHPSAYCVEGKGRDLGGVVHEWAGEPSDVECLLRGLARRLGRSLCVLSPESEPAPVDGSEILQPFAQIMILRPKRFGTSDPVAVFGDARTPARTPIYVWGLDSV